jgi:hypothetical protein
MRTDFAHVAQHQEFHSCLAREHGDGRAHRIRIGVVGIVEDDGTALTGPFLQPPLHRLETGEPAHDRGQAGAGGSGRCGSGKGVAHVVHPGRVQTDLRYPLGSAQYDFAAEIA